MDEPINCFFSSPINILTKGMSSFQAPSSLQSLQYVLQHISKTHTVCIRGEINQCHISGLWVTVAPLIIWEMWKRGGVTHIWQKQWLIFTAIWAKCMLSDCSAGNNLHGLGFFHLQFKSFLQPFLSLLKIQYLIEWNRQKEGSIIQHSSSCSQGKTTERLSY